MESKSCERQPILYLLMSTSVGTNLDHLSFFSHHSLIVAPKTWVRLLSCLFFVNFFHIYTFTAESKFCVIQPFFSLLCQFLWVLSSINFHFSYWYIYCDTRVRLSCLNLCQLLSLSQRRLETAKGGKLAPNLQSLAKTLGKWWMGLFQGYVHTYIDFCETF